MNGLTPPHIINKRKRGKCAVLDCPNFSHNSTVNYFKTFPLNYIRARIWITLCGNPSLNDMDLQKIRSKHSVCARHFAPQQFRTVLKTKLRINEIPTLFMPPGSEDFIQQYDRKEFAAVLMRDASRLRIELAISGKTQSTSDESAENDEFADLLIEFLTGKKVNKKVRVAEKPELEEVILTEAEALKEPEYMFNSVRISSKKGSIGMCRMCMRETNSSSTSFNEINPRFGKTFADIIEYLYPEYNMRLYRNPLICASCSELVTNSYELRKTWENTEDVLEKYKNTVSRRMQNYAKHQNLQENFSVKIIDPLLDHDYTNTPKLLQEFKPIFRRPRLKRKRVTLPATTDLFDSKINKYFRLKNPARVRVAKPNIGWGKAPFLCWYCGKFYTNKGTFIGHLSQHKLAKSKDSFKCPKCMKLFASEYFFENHQKTCGIIKKQRVGQCHICGKQVIGGMFAHQIRHKKEQWTKSCDICNKKFPMNCFLKKHMQSHREGEFICGICGKVLKKEDSLRLHIEIVHENRGKYRCLICDKSFPTRLGLVNHFRCVHAGKTEYALLQEKEIVEVEVEVL